jgi:hypothetical protein
LTGQAIGSDIKKNMEGANGVFVRQLLVFWQNGSLNMLKKTDCRVRMFAERTDKNSDRMLKSYFDAMREVGAPFDASSSSKYGPLSPETLRFRLLELRVRTKDCQLTQMADLYLYPMCRSGYDDLYGPHKTLREAGKLIEHHLDQDEIETMGIKFSCFD